MNVSEYGTEDEEDGYTSDNSESDISRNNSFIDLKQNPTGTALFGGQNGFVIQAAANDLNSGHLTKGFGLSDDSHIDTSRSESAQLSHSDTFKLRGARRKSLLEESL